jgi:hypothetical protein
MANFLACQTLGEMSNPSSARAVRNTQHFWLSLRFLCFGSDNTAQTQRNLTSTL